MNNQDDKKEDKLLKNIDFMTSSYPEEEESIEWLPQYRSFAACKNIVQKLPSNTVEEFGINMYGTNCL